MKRSLVIIFGLLVLTFIGWRIVEKPRVPKISPHEGGAPVHVNGEKEFKAQVLDAKGAVLVDFYADWCPPCRKLGPILEELAQEKAEVLKVVKVNVDKNKELSQRYKVSGIPHMILFKDGKESDTQTGFESKDALLQWLDPLLK